jgi:hypothetical protein
MAVRKFSWFKCSLCARAENEMVFIRYFRSRAGKLIKKLTIRCPPSSEAFVLRDGEFVARISATARHEELDATVEETSEDKSEDAADEDAQEALK